MSNANGDDTTTPGLTKPLINNIGGMIDQDAPSADQLLEHSPDGTWGEAGVVQDSGGEHSGGDDGAVIGAFDRREDGAPSR